MFGAHQLEALGLPESALELGAVWCDAGHVDPTDPEVMREFNASSDVATGKAVSADRDDRATKLMYEDAISTSRDDGRRDAPRLPRRPGGASSTPWCATGLSAGPSWAGWRTASSRWRRSSSSSGPCTPRRWATRMLERIPGRSSRSSTPRFRPLSRHVSRLPSRAVAAALRELANVARRGRHQLAGGPPRPGSMWGTTRWLRPRAVGLPRANPKAKVTEAFGRERREGSMRRRHFRHPPERRSSSWRAFGGRGGPGRAGPRRLHREWAKPRAADLEGRGAGVRFDGDDEAADNLAAFMAGSERQTPVFHGAVTDFDQFMFTQDSLHTGTADQGRPTAPCTRRATSPTRRRTSCLWVRGKFAEMKDLGIGVRGKSCGR
jgi:hypothetical protein